MKALAEHALTEVQKAAVRASLERVLASDKFAGAKRLSRFLKFVVEESLAGRGERLNQYAIGIEVFDRDTSFDPAIDPVVRVEAGRLRSKIRDYYEDESSSGQTRITMAKRGYAATFQFPDDSPVSQAPSLNQLVRALREAPRGPLPIIAILPFRNLSRDPEQEYFADGFSEDLITDLSTLPGLSVIARQSSFSYKSTTLGVQQIGRDLGADFVLTGSIRRAGEDVRINAQLVASASGEHRWAQRFDRRLSDIFLLQDDVNREIVAALRLRFSTEVEGSPVRRGTEIVDAYDYVLRGMNEAQTFTKEGAIRARYCFEQALKLDAGYSAAYARLAVNYVYWWIAGWTDSREESLEKGLDLAKRAVALDDGMSLSHAALCWALLWMGDFDNAVSEGERAVEIDPNNVVALEFLALVSAWGGQPALALEYLGRASRLNPHEPYYFARGLAYFLEEDYPRAADLLRNSVERHPHFLPAHVYLASCYGLLGDRDRARAVGDYITRVRPDFGGGGGPFRRAEDRNRVLRGLKVAGLR